MKKTFFTILALCLVACGCAGQKADAGPSPAQVASAGGANVFNPYMNKELPNLRKGTDEGKRMLDALGASEQSIEKEAAHRKNWREEIYPVVFGERDAPGEILVLLNFSSPDSEKVWSQVVDASKSLSPSRCKIVIFGNSKENYGSDLLGLGIWLAHSRKGQAMSYISYALHKWNEVKAKQKANGNLRQFINEYDAVATNQDYPIHYGYLSRLSPPLPHNQEMAVAKYCYDAGNVNAYQCKQIADYYGVSKLPAVIVNGKALSDPDAKNILAALK